jgi:hypothetical protein
MSADTKTRAGEFDAWAAGALRTTPSETELAGRSLGQLSRMASALCSQASKTGQHTKAQQWLQLIDAKMGLANHPTPSADSAKAIKITQGRRGLTASVNGRPIGTADIAGASVTIHTHMSFVALADA